MFKNLFVLALTIFTAQSHASEIRDPTRPMGYMSIGIETDYEQPMFSPLVLSGIIIGAKGGCAVINGQRVLPGDEIAGGRILAVEPGYVDIERGGERFRIDLLPLSVKKPAKQVSGGE